MIRFPLTPPATLSELWRACLDLSQQVDRVFLRDVTVGTSETSVSHGLTYVPQAAIPLQKSDARVWQSSDPDERFVYLTASASVICDIEVVR